MPIHILPKVPGFAEQLAQSLGGGISTLASKLGEGAAKGIEKRGQLRQLESLFPSKRRESVPGSLSETEEFEGEELSPVQATQRYRQMMGIGEEEGGGQGEMDRQALAKLMFTNPQIADNILKLEQHKSKTEANQARKETEQLKQQQLRSKESAKKEQAEEVHANNQVAFNELVANTGSVGPVNYYGTGAGFLSPGIQSIETARKPLTVALFNKYLKGTGVLSNVKYKDLGEAIPGPKLPQKVYVAKLKTLARMLDLDATELNEQFPDIDPAPIPAKVQALKDEADDEAAPRKKKKSTAANVPMIAPDGSKHTMTLSDAEAALKRGKGWKKG